MSPTAIRTFTAGSRNAIACSMRKSDRQVLTDCAMTATAPAPATSTQRSVTEAAATTPNGFARNRSRIGDHPPTDDEDHEQRDEDDQQAADEQPDVTDSRFEVNLPVPTSLELGDEADRADDKQ